MPAHEGNAAPQVASAKLAATSLVVVFNTRSSLIVRTQPEQATISSPGTEKLRKRKLFGHPIVFGERRFTPMHKASVSRFRGVASPHRREPADEGGINTGLRKAGQGQFQILERNSESLRLRVSAAFVQLSLLPGRPAGMTPGLGTTPGTPGTA